EAIAKRQPRLSASDDGDVEVFHVRIHSAQNPTAALRCPTARVPCECVDSALPPKISDLSGVFGFRTKSRKMAWLRHVLTPGVRYTNCEAINVRAGSRDADSDRGRR